MLFAEGETHVGASAIASHLAIDRDVLVYSVRRNGVCFDTAFVPASRAAPSDVVVLWLVARGTLRRHGLPVLEAPFAMTMCESAMEGANGEREVDLHTCSHFEAIELRFRRRWAMRAIDRAGVVSLTDDSWSHVGRYLSSALGADADDPDRSARVVQLVKAMHQAGVVHDEVLDTLSDAPDASMRALWPSVRSAFHLLDPSASIKTLAVGSGLSLRHTARMLAEMKRGLLTPPGGWRETIRALRAKLAVVLLSDGTLSIADVARAVGYQQAEAMTNAFRRDGLPPPREVRRRLLATHAG